MTDVRIITELLGGSPLSRAIQGEQVPDSWVPRVPGTADEWRRRARQRRDAADWGSRLAALAPAFQATGAAADRLERVARTGGVVVTTGQQPGLFGGPIYTWSKAVSALALADAIERATGVPTAAVFWAATDDADFAEASSTVVTRAGGVQVLRAELAPPLGTPMSLAPLGALDDALRGLREACGSAADARALEAAITAYGAPAHTTGDAFVDLLRAVLAPLGMPVLDASHAAVRAASVETLDLARHRAADVERALADRVAELRATGYDPQVDDVAGLSLVFTREDVIKRRLSVQEAALAPDASSYSPNVLLRPIVEHEILPTVAYVGGPGEVAYFAQVGAVAGALGLASPLVVPRWSCTLVEPAIDALLREHDATIADLALPGRFETRIARAAMSIDTDRALDGVRTSIASLPVAVAAESIPLGLEAAVQGAMQALLHRLDRLERRLVAGIKRREAKTMRDAGTLRGALYPLGKRQERTLNLVPLLARHGQDLLVEMRDAAAVHAATLIERPALASAPVTAP